MRNNGSFAFPVNIEAASGTGGIVRLSSNAHSGFGGMYLRDWFAGKALTGLLTTSRDIRPATLAMDAYHIADALLAEKEKL